MTARHCLLVVDDEAEVVNSLQDLLRFDYRVLGACRASEGLKLVQNEEVHIVMSDQRMPEMSGIEFLQQLRDLHPDIVRLLFTGYADIKAVIDAINQGSVFRYITKPWDVDELLTVLRQAGERYDMVQERKSLLAELQEKNRQLVAANALKEAFIKVASHELRTPLTIIMGLTELAQLTPGADEQHQRWLDDIHKGSMRLSRLIDQMIKLLMAGRFERPLNRVEASLADLMRQAAGDVAAFVARRKQTLEVDAPADLGVVAVEPDKLRDSMAHLLLNAVKFTPDGGRISLSGRSFPDGGVEIRVSDTGIGLDKQSLSRLFEPFFTGFDVSRHSSGVFEFDRRGLGLGLSLVKAFVEMHGGRVSAQSEQGKGSTFVITLPQQSR